MCCCPCRVWLRGLSMWLHTMFITLGIVFVAWFVIFLFIMSILFNYLSSFLLSAVPSSTTSSSSVSLYSLFSPFFNVLGYWCLAIGLVWIIVGVYGWVVTCMLSKYRPIPTYIHLGLLIVGILFWTSVIIVWFASTTARVASIKSALTTNLQTYFVDIWQTSSLNIFALMWNIINIGFQCCGVNGYTDFAAATKWNNSISFTYSYSSSLSTTYTVNFQIPFTCCKLTTSNFTACVTAPTTSNSNYQTNCYDAIYNTLIAPIVWPQYLVIGFYYVLLIITGVVVFFLLWLLREVDAIKEKVGV